MDPGFLQPGWGADEPLRWSVEIPWRGHRSCLSRTSTQTTASCAAPYKDARHLRSALSPGRKTLMLAAASATEGASFRHPRIRVSAVAPALSCQDGPDTHPSPGSTAKPPDFCQNRDWLGRQFERVANMALLARIWSGTCRRLARQRHAENVAGRPSARRHEEIHSSFFSSAERALPRSGR